MDFQRTRGSNEKYLLNGVTLVKSRDEAWPAEFL